MREGSNSVEMRVRATQEMLKLIRRRHSDRGTMNRTPITMMSADREVG